MDNHHHTKSGKSHSLIMNAKYVSFLIDRDDDCNYRIDIWQFRLNSAHTMRCIINAEHNYLNRCCSMLGVCAAWNLEIAFELTLLRSSYIFISMMVCRVV